MAGKKCTARWRDEYRKRQRRSKARLAERNKAAGKRASGDWQDRRQEYVNRAAKRGREYWPRGCRVPSPKPVLMRRDMARVRPWNAPGLTDAERWRIQYRLDPVFHAREYQKAQQRKAWRRTCMAEGDADPVRIAELKLQSMTCAYCTKPLPDVQNRHVDHVVPLARGGRHTWTNLAVVCVRCNGRKHAKLPTAQQQRAALRQRERVTGQLWLIA